jgi:hypothetical protein
LIDARPHQVAQIDCPYIAFECAGVIHHHTTGNVGVSSHEGILGATAAITLIAADPPWRRHSHARNHMMPPQITGSK